MPNIVSSTVFSDSPQADGRRWICEQHTDLTGLQYFFWWMALATDLANSQLVSHAAQLGNDLASQEIAANITAALNQGVPPLTFNYSTFGQGEAAVRLFFATVTGFPAQQMANFLSNLHLTDTSLETVFSVTSGAQLTALKANLANLTSAYAITLGGHGQ